MSADPPRERRERAGGLPEVELAPGTLVIGDLHLDLDREGPLRDFAAWLAAEPARPRLVVLGDLFEYWIGPAHADTPGARLVLEALAARTGAGTAIDVVPGNRDFLLDEGFERATGCVLRRDGFVGRSVGGRRVLFVHGDELCTLDRGYLLLRAVVRSRPVGWLAPRLPGGAARALARRLRRVSRRAVAGKTRGQAEQQASACDVLARRHRADTVVCGHAHRFRDERLPGGARWLVVDAFGGARDALELGEGGELVPRPALRKAAGGVRP